MITNLTNLFVKTVYAADVVGKIALPSGLKIPSEVNQTNAFITVIVRFFIIIAGLFTLWQFLSGGLAYITSNGDKTKTQEAGQKITMSITGLVIIAASFIIIAIVSKVLFGTYTAILKPSFISI